MSNTPKFNLLKNGQAVQRNLSYKKAQSLFTALKPEEKKDFSVQRADIDEKRFKALEDKKKKEAKQKAAEAAKEDKSE